MTSVSSESTSSVLNVSVFSHYSLILSICELSENVLFRNASQIITGMF